MVRERAVNKISRRGKQLRRLTGRGTKLTIGGETEIEDLTRKLAESEDLQFSMVKPKLKIHALKPGVGAREKLLVVATGQAPQRTARGPAPQECG